MVSPLPQLRANLVYARPLLLLQPIGQRIPCRAVIFIRQEFARHGDLDPVALGIGQPLHDHVEIASPMMPSPNSSSISAFQAGPLTITSK